MNINPRESYGHGPVGPAYDLSRVTGIDLHHSAGSWSWDVKGDLRSIAEATRRKWGRSSYQFAIHPQDPDNVWEMQGLHIGAHNDGENSTRIGLLVVGNFETRVPDDRIVQTAGKFLAYAHQSGWITRQHIKGHRDTDATACPGRHLYARLDDIRTIASEEDMAFNEHQEKVLKQVVAALDSEDSNGWFAAEAVKHLRSHPSGGGLSVTDVEKIAKKEIANSKVTPA